MLTPHSLQEAVHDVGAEFGRRQLLAGEYDDEVIDSIVGYCEELASEAEDMDPSQVEACIAMAMEEIEDRRLFDFYLGFFVAALCRQRADLKAAGLDLTFLGEEVEFD